MRVLHDASCSRRAWTPRSHRESAMPRKSFNTAHSLWHSSHSRGDQRRRRAMWRSGNAGPSPQDGWSLDEVADAEMRHVRNSLRTVEVTEFGSGFLAGVHAGDSSATRMM